MIVGVCVVVALLIVGAAAYKPIKDWWDGRQFDEHRPRRRSAPRPRSARRSPPRRPTATRTTCPTGTPVDYEDAPPAFGPHWNEAGVAPAPIERKFYTADDRPELEALVHNLEHGYTILWYDETIADDDDAMTEIRGDRRQVRRHDELPRQVHRRAVDVRRRGGKKFPDGQHVAFTHWSAGGAGETDAKKQVGRLRSTAPSPAARRSSSSC